MTSTVNTKPTNDAAAAVPPALSSSSAPSALPLLDTNFPLNLACLDGIRCLACFAVVFYHVHWVHGSFFFPSTFPCFAAMRNTSIRVIGDWFMEVSWHMTTFWLLSGFLCERQLHRMVATRSAALEEKQGSSSSSSSSSQWRLLVAHFVNRLLRLYPLYFLMNMLSFHQTMSRPELAGPDMVNNRCDAANLWRALTFTMNFRTKGLMCAGVGWTLQNDIHGHLAIAALFALTQQFTYGNANATTTGTTSPHDQRKYLRYKQLFWWTCYAFSVYRLVASNPFPSQSLEGPALQRFLQSARLGMDYYGDKEMASLGLHNLGLDDIFPGERLSAMAEEIREFRLNSIFRTYFTGIGGHASAVLLGSLLYTNVYERQGRPSNTVWKLLAATMLLLVSGGSFMFSGLAVYWILDCVLTFRPTASRWSTAVYRFFSNPVFRAIAPYTFGIYFYHLTYLAVRFEKLAPLRVAAVKAGEDACSAVLEYNWRFLWKGTLEAFLVALMIAFISRWTFEYPFHWLRGRYVKSQHAATTVKSKVL